ncbi:DUF488 domain-containing protein [Danxiaibacter flavus]|uniref:DUF488 domain-containing protein n=1 Tax=Danxiaibacter flavus TaxID=3049108 RepID=A0ABV3ZQI4_9BACT|nr:DUF488 domain-containing protein [Chitinophagaceae bacterium DXS]
MFYRRKIILALLQICDGRLHKISLQKLLFLISERQTSASYDFVPYLYGCYSFSANADLSAMVKRGYLEEDKNHFTKKCAVDYFATLKEDDKKILTEVKGSFENLSVDELMKFTYLNYGYYAINSIKTKEILTETDYKTVKQRKPYSEKTILYTIGYEGVSLETYLNKLIKNDVKMLVDVRNNPISMKFGFSKSQLAKFVASLGIEYVHLPEVGIQSDQRRTLKTQEDYDQLFQIYKQHNLKETVGVQEHILKLLQKKKRIALTCFEADICQCHRKHLAESITKLSMWRYEIEHL